MNEKMEILFLLRKQKCVTLNFFFSSAVFTLTFFSIIKNNALCGEVTQNEQLKNDLKKFEYEEKFWENRSGLDLGFNIGYYILYKKVKLFSAFKED